MDHLFTLQGKVGEVTSDDLGREALYLLESGMTFAAIARKLGIDRKRVKQIIKEYKRKLRREGVPV